MEIIRITSLIFNASAKCFVPSSPISLPQRSSRKIFCWKFQMKRFSIVKQKRKTNSPCSLSTSHWETLRLRVEFYTKWTRNFLMSKDDQQRRWKCLFIRDEFFSRRSLSNFHSDVSQSHDKVYRTITRVVSASKNRRYFGNFSKKTHLVVFQQISKKFGCVVVDVIQMWIKTSDRLRLITSNKWKWKIEIETDRTLFIFKFFKRIFALSVPFWLKCTRSPSSF